MKLKLLLPFAAALLAGAALGQQSGESPAQREPIPGELRTPAVAPPRREARLFVFPGGTPAEFLTAVDKAMGSHLSEIASIPEEAKRIHVPQIRAKIAEPEEALAVYRAFTEPNGALGRWEIVWNGEVYTTAPAKATMSTQELQALIFSMPPSVASQEDRFDVRAVSLRDIPEGKWKAFTELLNETVRQAGRPAQPFTLKIHSETGVLVATGGKEQVDRVETLAASMRASFAARSETGGDGVKARAFSIAGLPAEKVARVVEEMTNRSGELHGLQEKLAELTGTPVGAGVHIFGTPEVVESLQVLVVAGSSAGLEFAGSLIEEVKRAMEAEGTGKFVIVDGPGVRSQGSVPWTAKLTVLDAVAAAGGQSESQKSYSQIQLTRGGTTRLLETRELKFDPAKNERVQPGDRIEVGYWGPQAKPTPGASPEKP